MRGKNAGNAGSASPLRIAWATSSIRCLNAAESLDGRCSVWGSGLPSASNRSGFALAAPLAGVPLGGLAGVALAAPLAGVPLSGLAGVALAGLAGVELGVGFKA